jgi:hypothetical protein
MAQDLAALQVSLELQTAAFQAGVKQVDRRLKGMDKNIQKTSKGFRGMEKGLTKLKGGLAGIAASMAAAFSVQSVKNAIAFGDEIAKSAETVGLAVDEFQQFSYVADRAGIATSQFSSNMVAFVKRVGEAQAGVGPLVSGLQKMDSELLKSVTSAKSQGEAFKLVLDALNNAATAADKARIANAAFSRSGVAMGRMAEDYKNVADEAERLGLVMSEKTAKRAEVLQDKLTEMATSFKVSFTSAVIDATARMAEFFGIIDQVDSNAQKLADAQARLATVTATAEAFEKKTGQVAGRSAQEIAYLTDKIAHLTRLVKEEELPALNAAGSAIQGTTEDFSKFATSIGYAIDPYKRLREEAEKTAKALAAGVITQKDADAYIAVLLQQVMDIDAALEKEEKAIEKVTYAWEGLGDAMRLQAETANLSYDSIMENIDGFADSAGMFKDVGTDMLGAFTDSFDSFANGVAAGTTKVKDLFKNMVQSLIAQFLKLMAYKGIMSMLGGPGTTLGGQFATAIGSASAKGNIFNHGSVQAFATGGIVGSPTTFPMANGKTGLMGEAGPEAIMPLKRGPGGELGVNAVQPVVNINNNAPVAVNATSNGDGSVDITIVERAVESAIRRGGNGITSALESVYGNNRGSGAFGY